MLRPTGYFSRQSTADIGETLQSDVMRFMAILALCLVAIFALVQSLPLQPVENSPVVYGAPDKVATDPPETTETRPVDTAMQVSKNPVVPVVSAAPEEPAESVKILADWTDAKEEWLSSPHAIEVESVDRVKHSEAVRARPEKIGAIQSKQSDAIMPAAGLLLRFSSDNALLALVAQKRIELYAWSAASAWRLTSERGVVRFVSASAPKQLNSMSPDTVPSTITKALIGVLQAVPVEAMTFGVKLPTSVKRQIKHLISQHTSGELVIHADGSVQHDGAE